MIKALRSDRLSVAKDVVAEQPMLDPLYFAMASRDADVLSLVQDALAAGRAQLAFQPVVITLDHSKTAFHEGLIRVKDSAGRVIPAAHFMPVIEDMDLGRQVDVVTLELALKTLRHHPGIRLSVNVSARSLGDGRWRRVLDAALNERASLGDRLIFEMSETSVMLLHEIVAQFMEEMQPRGVAFALDGFGAGMTAFRHLKEFFFDLVKIDKSFVRGIANDPDNQVLAEALITVAQQFEMFTVADGVETAEDATYLATLGVDCLQGYHFGIPSFRIS
ncbi:EAL domain-containing protein [Cognatiyoonia koreensis]